MTTKYSTKKALISSIVVLALCFSMLIGTTFAWFTDSASSNGNIIKTGNLDVEMYWADGKEDPANTNAWNDASEGAIFNYDNWEPGYAEVRHVRISNLGSLALKYKVLIVADGEVSDLADVIDVYYADPAVQITNRADLNPAMKLGTLTDVLANIGATGNGTLEAGSEDTITLALVMQESAGNEYMNKSIGASFTIQVLATQLTYEPDSFDNQYDADAQYPTVELGTVDKAENETADVKTNSVNVNVPANAPAGNYTVEVTDKTTTTDAEGVTTVSMDITLKKDGAKVTADGTTVYTVSVEIGKGYTDVSATHNGNAITVFDYDAVTGIFTFETSDFSPFAFTYKDVPASVEGEEGKLPVVAFISGESVVYYASLEDAIKAVKADQTIVLVSNLNYENVVSADNNTTSINIPKDKKFTLDLNGYTMFGVSDFEKSFSFITINAGADVTINDSSAAKTGMINYQTVRANPNENQEGYTIKNLGNLTLNGGTIYNSSPLASNGYEQAVTTAVDNCSSSGVASSFSMNGGTVISDTYFAVRSNVYANNTFDSGKAMWNINGGTVYGLHFCDWGSKGLDYKLNVGANATVKCGNYPDYLTQSVRMAIASASTSKVEINIAGTIEGAIYGAGANIGTKYYSNFKKALDDAQPGDTITMLKNYTATDIIYIDKDITINGNGFEVKSSSNRVFRLTTSNIKVTMNNVNIVSGAAVNYPSDIRGVSIDAGLTGVELTLNDCSVDFTDISANDWTYAVNVSGNGTGHKVTINGGTYEGANVINAHGANNTIVVKNATLTSMYPHHDEYYGAGIWVLQNQGSSVVAEGNTFNGTNAVAFNLGTGTALTESNNVDNTVKTATKG